MPNNAAYVKSGALATALLLVAALAPAAHAQTETVLHYFVQATGYSPQGGLIADSAGNLYGTTSSGGSAHQGTVFRLDRSGHYSVLHNFTGPPADGAYPYSGLARDNAGNLYGTTLNGGAIGYGAVYKLDVTGRYSILYSFPGRPGGDGAYSGLTLDSDGNLYGTTYYGGLLDVGLVYKLDPSGRFTLLHSFAAGSDGAFPYGVVTFDAAGNLYGTTAYGGQGKKGVAYKIEPSGQELILHNFTGGDDGGEPLGGIIADAESNLYGTTYIGGAFGSGGVVFKLDSAGAETVLHNFGGPNDCISPAVGLSFDTSGNLYGVCGAGDYSEGSIFKIDRVTHEESILYSISESQAFFNGPLLLFNGNIYGTQQVEPGFIYKLSLGDSHAR